MTMKESAKRFFKQFWIVFCVELSVVTLFFLILNRISPLPATFVRRLEYGATVSLVTALTSTAFFRRPCRTWSSLWLRRVLFLLTEWVEISLIACLYFPTSFSADQIICTWIALVILGGGVYGVCDLVWWHKLKKINQKLEENEQDP